MSYEYVIPIGALPYQGTSLDSTFGILNLNPDKRNALLVELVDPCCSNGSTGGNSNNTSIPPEITAVNKSPASIVSNYATQVVPANPNRSGLIVSVSADAEDSLWVCLLDTPPFVDHNNATPDYLARAGYIEVKAGGYLELSRQLGTLPTTSISVFSRYIRTNGVSVTELSYVI